MPSTPKIAKMAAASSPRETHPTRESIAPDAATLEMQRATGASRAPYRTDPTKITSGVRHITPQVAQELLARMPHNRSIKVGKLNAYKADMLAGRWMVNGEAIVIDETGAPINGQHRLTACVQSGVPFDSLVVEGVPRERMATIDTGAPRSYRDVVQLRGGVTNYAATLAAAARLWVKYHEDALLNTQRVVSHAEIDEVLAANAQLVTSAEFVTGMKTLRTYCYASVQTVVHALMTRDLNIGGDYADLFMSDLDKGAGLAEDSPIYLLRRRLVERERSDRRLPQYEVFALTVKAANAWLDGHRLRVLVWRPAEDIPRIGRITPGARYGRKKRGQSVDTAELRASLQRRGAAAHGGGVSPSRDPRDVRDPRDLRDDGDDGEA